MKNSIGVLGLGVMGANIARNIASKGFSVSVYNIEPEKYVKAFIEKGYSPLLSGTYSLEEFVSSLETPRKIWLMITAGSPVDEMLAKLIPLLEADDIVIDGGNSNYLDTERRADELKEKGIRFVGMGVSGGSEGALHGPCLMPGGEPEAYRELAPILTAVCAKAENGPCCAYMGSRGTGHFVKMVHNGIEYGDMQLIAEAYLILRTAGKTNAEIAAFFEQAGNGRLSSYLLDITCKILKKKDELTGDDLIDHVLDTASQKGTGKWASEAALNYAQPLTLITEAVLARCLSANLASRRQMAKVYPAAPVSGTVDTDDLEKALFCGRVIAYAQGFSMISAATDADLHAIAEIWQGGCIIRSKLLHPISAAYSGKKPDSLLADPAIAEEIRESIGGMRNICAFAMMNGIPVPALSSALAYFDGMRLERSGANLIQAQRDCFGSHTYQRNDDETGKAYHTEWME